MLKFSYCHITLQPKNAHVLAKHAEFRQDFKDQISYYNKKYRGLIYVECEDLDQMIIKINHNNEKKLAKKIKDDFEDLLNKYKVEEREISFSTYLPQKDWEILKNEVFNLMNENNLGNDFLIKEGELIVKFLASLSKTKKIK